MLPENCKKTSPTLKEKIKSWSQNFFDNGNNVRPTIRN